MVDIIEEIKMEEESVYDKINGLTAEINQMEWMIEENVRLIAEGDDVEGRTYLMQHLKNEVSKKKVELSKLESQMQQNHNQQFI